jgi:NAD(P)-dependent dehydrogenase (short-subunit alcohol dehydrogenase family)
MAKAGSLAGIQGIEILELEVTLEESVRQCAKAVEKLTGGSLDILVNNAGTAIIMPLLDVSIDDAKKMFDTNVWAILAMAQAFAPMLIKAKGVICNISSVSCELVFAWMGTLWLPPRGYQVIGLNRHKKMLVYTKKQNVDIAAKNVVNDVLSGSSPFIRRGEASTISWFGNTFLPYGIFTSMINGDSGLAEVGGK